MTFKKVILSSAALLALATAGSFTATANSVSAATLSTAQEKLSCPPKIKTIAQKAANKYMANYYSKASASYLSYKETPLADTTLYTVKFSSKFWVKGTVVTVTVNSKGQVLKTSAFLPAD